MKYDRKFTNLSSILFIVKESLRKNYVNNALFHDNFIITDIGACEQILGKKTKGDFEEYLQTEHSNVLTFSWDALSMKVKLGYMSTRLYVH